MKESIKLTREIVKKCFKMNKPDDGDILFDTKLCAKIIEENLKVKCDDCLELLSMMSVG